MKIIIALLITSVSFSASAKEKQTEDATPKRTLASYENNTFSPAEAKKMYIAMGAQTSVEKDANHEKRKVVEFSCGGAKHGGKLACSGYVGDTKKEMVSTDRFKAALEDYTDGDFVQCGMENCGSMHVSMTCTKTGKDFACTNDSKN